MGVNEGKMRRLIESSSFPLKELSELSAQEKMRRKGHIQTFHIWWARRPLASTRATLIASLLPDPLDESYPMKDLTSISPILRDIFDPMGVTDADFNSRRGIFEHLLKFVSEFADYENGIDGNYLTTARQLVKVGRKIIHSREDDWKIMDCFVGGGSLQVESNRLGCETFVGDLNPVPVLINTILAKNDTASIARINQVLEQKIKTAYQKLIEECTAYYPLDQDGKKPIAWFHSLLATCPSCESEVPLLKSMWLLKKEKRRLHATLEGDASSYYLEFHSNFDDEAVPKGIVIDGEMTCPWCSHKAKVSELAEDISQRRNTERESTLLAVMVEDNGGNRSFRAPNDVDLQVLSLSRQKSFELEAEKLGEFSLIPDELLPIPPDGRTTTLGMGVMAFGMKDWGSFFTPRQKVTHGLLVKILRELRRNESNELSEDENREVNILLAFCMSRFVDKNANVCLWNSQAVNIEHVMSQNHLNPVWSYVEGNPIGGWTADWEVVSSFIPAVLERRIKSVSSKPVHVHNWSAFEIPLHDESIDCVHIDPPYYDSVPYADLSDFFIVWLKRLLYDDYPEMLKGLSPKEDECIRDEVRGKSTTDYEDMMAKALGEIHRVLTKNGILCLVFASKSWKAWEALLSSLVRANFTIETSWPIQTEKRGRLRSYNSAALNASHHLVCRPTQGKLERKKIPWEEHYEILTEELDVRIRVCLEQGIFGIDAVASCMSVAFNLLSKSVPLDHDAKPISFEEYLAITYSLISQRTFSILLPDEILDQIDGVSRMVLSAYVAVSDKDESSLDLDQFNALCLNAKVKSNDVEQYLTVGPDGVELVDLSSLKRGALVEYTATVQMSIDVAWGQPQQNRSQQDNTEEVAHESNYMIDEMIHCMNLFENGTTALRTRLADVENVELFQAYVSAFFQMAKHGSEMRKLLEGVLQGF
jgi:adenine-specific DNA methylase